MIAGHRLGAESPCFIVAEAGVNHNGDLRTARRLVDVAVEARADAVKFQTFKAERLATAAAPKARYQRRTPKDAESQLEMLRRLELSPQAHRALADYCRRRTILFLSSPFDEESVEALARLEVPAFKIASGELTNLPLLERIARTGRPVILSTGMSTLEEVHAAVRALRGAGTTQVVLLHCVSSYPARAADANLRAMATLARAFRVPVGYSDHTPGVEVALAAVALGACLIEKHVTLDRALPGPDHRASLEPQEFAALVRGIRTVELAMGDGRKHPAPGEIQMAAVARRSLVAAQDVRAGTRFTEALIAIKRPGTGLTPALRPRLVGRVAKADIAVGTPLTWEMVA
ncbi:MAG: N-acetylneuraminate synthase [Candidatus Omnitrophica bacterium]|nr:N-acetylneuraminate synthase [Candidatus Omnitrophota bacterium]